MATIEREWVALTSATSARAGHGPHPCQGLYHRPAGAATEGGVHRDPLQRRLLRALPRRAAGRARHRVPRLEHPLPRQRGLLPPRARARRHRRRRAVAARGGRRRRRRDRRQLRRRLADGRVPVAGDRPVDRADRRAAAPRRGARPARRPTSTSRSTRTPVGPRCSPRGWTRRSPTRPTRSRWTRPSTCSTPRTVRRTHRSSSSATGPPRWPATTASPRGRAAELERLQAGAGVGSRLQPAPGVGRPPLRRPHARPVGPSRRLLRRRSPRRQLRAVRHRRHEHAAVLAVDVEPRDVAVPRRPAPRAHHGAVARRAVARRPRRLPERRPRHPRRAGRAGQDPRAASPASTTSRTPGPPRSPTSWPPGSASRA